VNSGNFRNVKHPAPSGSFLAIDRWYARAVALKMWGGKLASSAESPAFRWQPLPSGYD
jgi:hypothetical protein